MLDTVLESYTDYIPVPYYIDYNHCSQDTLVEVVVDVEYLVALAAEDMVHTEVEHNQVLLVVVVRIQQLEQVARLVVLHNYHLAVPEAVLLSMVASFQADEMHYRMERNFDCKGDPVAVVDMVDSLY